MSSDRAYTRLAELYDESLIKIKDLRDKNIQSKANVRKLSVENTKLNNKIDFLENDLFALNGILLNCTCKR